VRCSADERKSLEQVFRYITRPAQANERVPCNAAGQVVLKLKVERRHHAPDAVTAEVHEEAAAQMPRLRLLRFRGTLAPSAICVADTSCLLKRESDHLELDAAIGPA
jgi:Putative transposase